MTPQKYAFGRRVAHGSKTEGEAGGEEEIELHLGWIRPSDIFGMTPKKYAFGRRVAHSSKIGDAREPPRSRKLLVFI